MLDVDFPLWTVTDLKQYMYCARIAYYHTCLPDIRPTTRKMQSGIRRHEDEHKRSLRRTMNLPNLESAQRLFDVPVQSDDLHLSGQIDEVILYDDCIIPVDYKLAKKAGRHFKVQLAAYGMMAEETFGLPARKGLLYLIRSRQTVEVSLTTHWRQQVRKAITAIEQISVSEHMPPPTAHRQRCRDCEFRRFCNDV